MTMAAVGPTDDDQARDLRAWLERLPKVELHLHLEGAIPEAVLWDLIHKYGGDREVADRQALAGRLRFRDFEHFIDTWVWKNGFLREYDDFTLIAEAVARSLSAQNVIYAEVFFSPRDFRRFGLETQALAAAIRRGLARVEAIDVALIGDLVRDFGEAAAAVTLRELAEVRDLGVIGIGIGGSEQLVPPERFARVYRDARRLGFRTTAHAGEAAGAGSVWGAVRALEVDRIGHGARAIEDPELVAHLAETQLPLEMCPLSNLRTGVVASIAAHPIREFFDRGLRVTVNTDDPAMFGNSLAGELEVLVTELGFTRCDVRTLMRNAIAACWAAPSQLDALWRRFEP
jgi:adenosine deaminase